MFRCAPPAGCPVRVTGLHVPLCLTRPALRCASPGRVSGPRFSVFALRCAAPSICPTRPGVRSASPVCLTRPIAGLHVPLCLPPAAWPDYVLRCATPGVRVRTACPACIARRTWPGVRGRDGRTWRGTAGRTSTGDCPGVVWVVVFASWFPVMGERGWPRDGGTSSGVSGEPWLARGLGRRWRSFPRGIFV